MKHTKSSLGTDLTESEKSCISSLKYSVPRIVDTIESEMHIDSSSMRFACISVLNQLRQVFPGALANKTDTFIPAIISSLEAETANMNEMCEVLSFLHYLLVFYLSEPFLPHNHLLLPSILKHTQSDHIETAVQAFCVLRELIRIIGPLENYTQRFNIVPLVGDICNYTSMLIDSTENIKIEQEAICTMGHIILNFGTHLRNELQFCLYQLMDKLENEHTRMDAIDAFDNIVHSRVIVELLFIIVR